MLKKVTNIVLWVLLSGGMLALLGFAEVKRNTTPCKEVTIKILQNNAGFFITPFDVREIISKQQGQLTGTPMGKINSDKIEQALSTNPYIISAQVYATLNGSINIQVTQRKPIAMVMNSNGESYYLDSNGSIMPLSPNYTARTLLVSGMLTEPYAKYYRQNMRQLQSDTSVHTLLTGVYKLADYICRHPFWKAQITQVYIDSTSDFCLIPRVGNQRIIFGDTSNLAQKFDKLWVFYQNGLNPTGRWNKYSTINLKYKYQIVCTKK